MSDLGRNVSASRNSSWEQSQWFWINSALLSLIAILGNGTVMFIILKRQRLHTAANWFIFSLSTADLCVGFFVFPTSLICKFLLVCKGFPTGIVQELFLYFLVSNVCILTLDRYLFIVSPLRYHLFMNKKKVRLLIFPAWAAPVVVFLLHFTWIYSGSAVVRKDALKIFTCLEAVCFVAIPCLALLTTYARVCCLTRKLLKETSRQRSQVLYNNDETCISVLDSAQQLFASGNNRNSIVTNGEHVARYKKRNFSRRERQRSTLKLLGFVVIVFVTCWSLSLYASFCSYLNLCNVSRLAVRISWTLLYTNSAVNFLAYAFLKKDIGHELFVLLCCVRCSTNSNRQYFIPGISKRVTY